MLEKLEKIKLFFEDRFSKFKKKPDYNGVAKNHHKDSIKKQFQKKIGKLNLRKKEAHNDFLDVMKEFFSQYLHVKYEFTLEELEKEINDKKIKTPLKNKILDFNKRLSDAMYGEEEMVKEDLKKFVEEAKEILEKI